MQSDPLRSAHCETHYRNAHCAIFFRLGLVSATLIGWLLRLPLLDRFPFREDEAIYSYWALHFWRVDPFFLHVWPDKPPVFISLLALCFQALGVNAISARWLNLALSTLTIPLVAALAQHWWGRWAGLIAAGAFALNPYAISFAPTAYTDPLLVLTGLLACYCAQRQRPGWAGLWLGLAIMSKQQGVLYLPLVIGCLLLPAASPHRPNPIPNAPGTPIPPPLAIHHSPFTIHHFFCFLLGLGLIILPILYWDSQRWAVAPSPWDLSIRHYGALTLLPPTQWPARLITWAPNLWYLTASWPVWLLLIGLLAVNLPASLAPGRLLALWGLFFLFAHLLTSVQPWDRYLLPLAPLVALSLGGLLTTPLAQRMAWPWWVGSVGVGLLLLLPPAWQAAHGRLPIGGDHGAYEGLREALTWVQTEQPATLILYQRVLGWHYHFYLYDQVEQGAYELRWFPNATYLAANAAQVPGQPRLLIEPDWAADRDLRPRLAQAGLHLAQQARFGRFTVYRLAEERAGGCRWCYCGPHFPFPPLTTAADPVMMSLRG